MRSFYEKYKVQINALMVAPGAFVAIYFISKPPIFSCDDYAKNFKNSFECHMILSAKGDYFGIVRLFGKDLYTKRETIVEDGSKWLSGKLEKFQLGDTIIKNKGEYTVTVRGKRGELNILFECDREYKDTVKAH